MKKIIKDNTDLKKASKRKKPKQIRKKKVKRTKNYAGNRAFQRNYN